MQVKFELNGSRVELTVDDPEMPLVWLLRDQLRLTGTKYSCGEGVCGACSVLVDDEVMRSCVFPVSACMDKQITTIEGLSSKGLNPVQQAWLDADIPQCGFCQPGQIINLTGFLEKHPEPDEKQLITALSANYCRCKTYPDMLAAAKQAVQYFNDKKTSSIQAHVLSSGESHEP